MNMNMSGIETFTTPESIENTVNELKTRVEILGKNPAFEAEVTDLKLTLKNIEEKIAANKN